jgi:hypothetical protein
MTALGADHAATTPRSRRRLLWAFLLALVVVAVAAGAAWQLLSPKEAHNSTGRQLLPSAPGPLATPPAAGSKAEPGGQHPAQGPSSVENIETIKVEDDPPASDDKAASTESATDLPPVSLPASALDNKTDGASNESPESGAGSDAEPAVRN